ncbi:hypothetical protein GCM10027271_53160 [Saccharopolyspora gloriosae]
MRGGHRRSLDEMREPLGPVWDSPVVTALVARFAARGVAVEITGLDEHSARLHARLSEAEPAPAG